MAVTDAPLVSVVVPVLNGERYLRETLDSILAQTYAPIELIVMDDASSDGTGEIIASYGTAVAHRRQRGSKGIYANANDGIAIARGELIAVYHGDDVYEPSMVEREVAYLHDNPRVGAVFAADVFIDQDGREFGRLKLPAAVAGGRPLDHGALLDALLRNKNTFLRCPSSMVRASVYRELGGYDQERFRNTSDLEMWLRIARHHQLAVIDEHLWRYRRGHGSSSERYHALRTDPERFFRIVDLELARLPQGELVASDALDAYEAHRVEDQLKIAASHYILRQRDEGRATLATVSPARLLRPHPRPRLIAFYVVMWLLLAAAPNAAAAALLRRRIYGRLAAGLPIA